MILLVSGQEVLIDEEDLPKVCSTLALSINKNTGYACMGARSFHSIIMPAKAGFEVDHINRNKLDNRKENLRYVTHQQNLLNCKVRKDNCSGVKGVTWRKDRNCWTAQVRYQNRKIHLGNFQKLEEAILARLKAEIEYYQESTQ